MFAASVDFELGQHFATNLVLWQHATNRIANYSLRLSLHAVADGLAALTGVAGVPRVATLFTLGTRVDQLFTVRQHNEIARVFVRGISWLVLAHQDSCNIRGDATNNFIFTIDDPPILLERFVSLCVV